MHHSSPKQPLLKCCGVEEQMLIFSESKPAIKKKKKKNRGIRTKADGRLFHGKQRSASESRAPSTKIWCWLHVMLILASDNVKNKKDQKKSSKQTSRGDCPKLGRSQARITMKDRNNFGSKSTNYKV